MTDTKTALAEIEVLPPEATEVIQQADLATDTIHTLTTSFQGFFDDARQWVDKAKAIQVTDITQTDKIAEARELRLKLRKIRTTSENTRKKLKEDSLRMGRAIDGMHNVLKAIVEPCEKHLKEQEDYVARLAEQRRQEIAAQRTEALQPFAEVCDPESFPLGTMSDDEFETLLAGAKSRHEQLVEARQKAEEERIAREKAEAEERERQRRDAEEARKRAKEAEAARLKAEEEARREREKAEAERKAAEEKAAAERRKIEKQARKEREEAEAKLRAEQEKAEAARRELEEQKRREEEARQKAEAEAKAKAKAEEAARQKAEQAPDRDKLQAFAEQVRNLEAPAGLKTDAAKTLAADIEVQCEKFARWIEKQIAEL